MRHLKYISLLAVAACCLFCGCNDKKESQDDCAIQYGTYTYTYDDGSVSTILLCEDSFCIQNGNYEYCVQFSVLEQLHAASQKAEADGLILTEAEKEAIQTACAKTDYTQYDGQKMAYVVEDAGDKDRNFVGKDADGNRIAGLQMTYYVNDKTIGFGDGMYTLAQ